MKTFKFKDGTKKRRRGKRFIFTLEFSFSLTVIKCHNLNQRLTDLSSQHVGYIVVSFEAGSFDPVSGLHITQRPSQTCLVLLCKII